MTGMIWSIATFAVMSLVCAFAWNYELLLAFRLVQGFGLGGEVPIAAVYISELARANVRGRFVMLYELIFPVGIVAASVLGLWVVPTLGWHYMFVVGAIPAVLVLFLRRVLPESPRWLANAGRLKEAELAIAQIERETEKATGQPLPAALADRQGRGKVRVTLRPFWTALLAENARRLAGLVHGLSGELRPYDLDADGLSHRVQATARCRAPLRLDYDRSRSSRRGDRGSHHRSRWAQASVRDVFRRCSGRIDSSVANRQIRRPSRYWSSSRSAYFFVNAINLGVYLYTPELYPTRVRALGVGTATAWLRLASMIGPTTVGFMIASGLSSVFLAFGIVALVTAIVTAWFAIETKKRVLEEISP